MSSSGKGTRLALSGDRRQLSLLLPLSSVGSSGGVTPIDPKPVEPDWRRAVADELLKLGYMTSSTSPKRSS